MPLTLADNRTEVLTIRREPAGNRDCRLPRAAEPLRSLESDVPKHPSQLNARTTLDISGVRR